MLNVIHSYILSPNVYLVVAQLPVFPKSSLNYRSTQQKQATAFSDVHISPSLFLVFQHFFFLEICLGLMVINYFPMLKRFIEIIILIIIIYKIIVEYYLHFRNTNNNPSFLNY